VTTPRNLVRRASAWGDSSGTFSATQAIELPDDERVAGLESLQNPIERGRRAAYFHSIVVGPIYGTRQPLILLTPQLVAKCTASGTSPIQRILFLALAIYEITPYWCYEYENQDRDEQFQNQSSEAWRGQLSVICADHNVSKQPNE